jgi:hypothetical protein
MIENCGIRCEPSNRKFGDVALQRAAVQKIAGDIVEPQALTEVVECLRRVHRSAFSSELILFLASSYRLRSRLPYSTRVCYDNDNRFAVGDAAMYRIYLLGKRITGAEGFFCPVA